MGTQKRNSGWSLQRIKRYPILVRLLIANVLVILVGAVIGTVITRQVVSLNVIELILLFSSIGVLFSLGMNYWVIRTVLLPLRELRSAVDGVKAGEIHLTETDFMRSDPDIHSMVLAINSMLERLVSRTRLLRALSERVINAQEEERKRIARTLHDDTAQSLSSLIIRLERLEANMMPISPETARQLAATRQLAIDILEELRKNIWDLRPSILDDLGLCPAIRWLARQGLGEAAIQVEFEFPSENIRLFPHLETMLFRVTQEALNNIIRHSHASHVIIRLLPDTSRICLEIEDDGRGFDPEIVAGEAISRKHLGLLGIQERISLVNGNLRIDSKPGKGVLLHVCVPFLEIDSMDPDDQIGISLLEAVKEAH